MRAARVPLTRFVHVRALALLGSVLLVASALTACTAPATDETTGSVGENGFLLELGDVTASAGKGVADAGRGVTLAHEDHGFTGSTTDRFVASVGRTVRLSLGDELQPRTPITLRFKIDPKDLPEGHGGLGVRTQSEGSSTVDVLPGSYDEKTGTLTVRTEHLSWFDPIAVKASDLFGGVANVILTGLKVQYPAPTECASSATVREATFSAEASFGAVPCFSVTKDGEVRVEFNSTVGQPLRVTSDPKLSGQENAGPTIDSALTLAVTHAFRGDSSTSELMPGSTLVYEFAPEEPIKTFNVALDPSALMLLYTAGILKTLTDGVPGVAFTDALDCVADIQASQDLRLSTDQLVGTWLRTFLNCGGQIVGLVPGLGAIWSLLVLAPNVIITSAISILRAASGAASGDIEVGRAGELIDDVDAGAYAVRSSQLRRGNVFWGKTPSYAFDTPSRNIQCAITTSWNYNEYVCQLRRHTYSVTKPSWLNCEGTTYQGFAVSGLGKWRPEFTCWPEGEPIPSMVPQVDDPRAGPAKLTARVLKPSQRITALGVTCTLSGSGGGETVRCLHDGGAGFTISISKYTLTGDERGIEGNLADG